MYGSKAKDRKAMRSKWYCFREALEETLSGLYPNVTRASVGTPIPLENADGSRLSPEALVVYIYAKLYGRCPLSVKKLSKLCGMGMRRTRKGVIELENKDLLRRIPLISDRKCRFEGMEYYLATGPAFAALPKKLVNVAKEAKRMAKRKCAKMANEERTRQNEEKMRQTVEQLRASAPLAPQILRAMLAMDDGRFGSEADARLRAMLEPEANERMLDSLDSKRQEAKDSLERQIDMARLDKLLSKNKMLMAHSVIAILTDFVIGDAEIRVNGITIPNDSAREVFGLLNCEHIKLVVDKYHEVQTPVTNTRAYILAMLYNAVTELELTTYNAINAETEEIQRRWAKTTPETLETLTRLQPSAPETTPKAKRKQKDRETTPRTKRTWQGGGGRVKRRFSDYEQRTVDYAEIERLEQIYIDQVFLKDFDAEAYMEERRKRLKAIAKQPEEADSTTGRGS